MNYLTTISVDEAKVTDTLWQLNLDNKEYEIAKKYTGSFNAIDEISTNKKNKIRDMRRAINDGVGQDIFRGTAYWLYNGISFYTNNIVNYKDDEDRMLAVSEGTQSKVLEKSLKLILQ
jgi:hypothetical protein